MQKFDIILEKRSGKSVLYVAVAAFIIFTLALTIQTIFSEFVWYYVIFFLVLLAGAFITLKGLYQFFFYKNVRLVAESDGQKLKFYCVNEKGKQFNVSADYKLDDISRIYIVKMTTRYLYKNFYYEIEGSSKICNLFKEKVDAFPSLYKASEEDRNAVLRFVNTLKPEIVTGYENIIQKIVN